MGIKGRKTLLLIAGCRIAILRVANKDFLSPVMITSLQYGIFMKLSKKKKNKIWLTTPLETALLKDESYYLARIAFYMCIVFGDLFYCLEVALLSFYSTYIRINPHLLKESITNRLITTTQVCNKKSVWIF